MTKGINKKNIDWSLLSMNEFIAVDIETTGHSYIKSKDKIIEIGAVRLKDGKIIDTFSSLLKSFKKLKPEIVNITNITDDMLEYAPTQDVVLEKFRNFIKEDLLVFHNAVFDWDNFLKPAFADCCIYPTNKVMDTMLISRETFKGKEYKHNLADLCTRLEIVSDGQHRAINDAVMTAKAYLKLKDMNIDKIPMFAEMDDLSHSMPDTNFYGKVTRVAYWELQSPRNHKIKKKRLYVTIKNGASYGTVYFDCLTKTWWNDKYPLEIKLSQIAKKTLDFLNLKSIEELSQYKN